MHTAVPQCNAQKMDDLLTAAQHFDSLCNCLIGRVFEAQYDDTVLKNYDDGGGVGS